MTEPKKPSDYDEYRHSVYLGPILPGKVREFADAQGWTVSRLIRIALYYRFDMPQQIAEELAKDE